MHELNTRVFEDEEYSKEELIIILKNLKYKTEFLLGSIGAIIKNTQNYEGSELDLNQDEYIHLFTTEIRIDFMDVSEKIKLSILGKYEEISIRRLLIMHVHLESKLDFFIKSISHSYLFIEETEIESSTKNGMVYILFEIQRDYKNLRERIFHITKSKDDE